MSLAYEDRPLAKVIAIDFQNRRRADRVPAAVYRIVPPVRHPSLVASQPDDAA